MLRSKRGLRYLSLAAVIFFTVSGGPYGLEPLLFYGRDIALTMLIVVPVCWDIPSILMVFELNSLMPVNGGYYQWVKRALGMRWAFYEGWWTWLYTFVDLAIYPVLFVEYASYFYPGIIAIKIPVCLAVIWGGAALNILGLQPLGKATIMLGGVVLIPFLLIFVHAAMHPTVAPVAGMIAGKGLPVFGLAMYTVMWNFIGWDNATTYAGEVDRPVRSYIIATAIAFVAIVAIYFAAVTTALHSGINLSVLNDKGFPVLGEYLGGRWLGIAVAIGGMASSVGIFLAVLLSVSRVPAAMADDKLLPAVLYKTHPRFNTPYISICLFATLTSLLVFFRFTELLFLDVTLYGMGLTLELVSLLVLRIKLPDAPRPFRIPLPFAALVLICLLPAAVLLVALISFIKTAGLNNPVVILTFCGIISAWPAWEVARWVKQRRALDASS